MCTSDDVAAANTAIGWPTGVPQSGASYSYLQFGNTPLYQPPSADIKSYHHLAILFFLSEALTVLHGIAWYSMIFQGPEFYIDTAEVILSDWSNAGA